MDKTVIRVSFRRKIREQGKVTLKIKPELLREIENAAQDYEIPVRAMVRWLLLKGLDEMPRRTKEG